MSLFIECVEILVSRLLPPEDEKTGLEASYYKGKDYFESQVKVLVTDSILNNFQDYLIRSFSMRWSWTELPYIAAQRTTTSSKELVSGYDLKSTSINKPGFDEIEIRGLPVQLEGPLSFPNIRVKAGTYSWRKHIINQFHQYPFSIKEMKLYLSGKIGDDNYDSSKGTNEDDFLTTSLNDDPNERKPILSNAEEVFANFQQSFFLFQEAYNEYISGVMYNPLEVYSLLDTYCFFTSYVGQSIDHTLQEIVTPSGKRYYRTFNISLQEWGLWIQDDISSLGISVQEITVGNINQLPLGTTDKNKFNIEVPMQAANTIVVSFTRDVMLAGLPESLRYGSRGYKNTPIPDKNKVKAYIEVYDKTGDDSQKINNIGENEKRGDFYHTPNSQDELLIYSTVEGANEPEVLLPSGWEYNYYDYDYAPNSYGCYELFEPQIDINELDSNYYMEQIPNTEIFSEEIERPQAEQQSGLLTTIYNGKIYVQEWEGLSSTSSFWCSEKNTARYKWKRTGTLQIADRIDGKFTFIRWTPWIAFDNIETVKDFGMLSFYELRDKAQVKTNVLSVLSIPEILEQPDQTTYYWKIMDEAYEEIYNLYKKKSSYREYQDIKLKPRLIGIPSIKNESGPPIKLHFSKASNQSIYGTEDIEGIDSHGSTSRIGPYTQGAFPSRERRSIVSSFKSVRTNDIYYLEWRDLGQVYELSDPTMASLGINIESKTKEKNAIHYTSVLGRNTDQPLLIDEFGLPLPDQLFTIKDKSSDYCYYREGRIIKIQQKNKLPQIQYKKSVKWNSWHSIEGRIQSLESRINFIEGQFNFFPASQYLFIPILANLLDDHLDESYYNSGLGRNDLPVQNYEGALTVSKITKGEPSMFQLVRNGYNILLDKFDTDVSFWGEYGKEMWDEPQNLFEDRMKTANMAFEIKQARILSQAIATAAFAFGLALTIAMFSILSTQAGMTIAAAPVSGMLIMPMVGIYITLYAIWAAGAAVVYASAKTRSIIMESQMDDKVRKIFNAIIEISINLWKVEEIKLSEIQMELQTKTLSRYTSDMGVWGWISELKSRTDIIKYMIRRSHQTATWVIMLAAMLSSLQLGIAGQISFAYYPTHLFLFAGASGGLPTPFFCMITGGAAYAAMQAPSAVYIWDLGPPLVTWPANWIKTIDNKEMEDFNENNSPIINFDGELIKDYENIENQEISYTTDIVSTE